MKLDYCFMNIGCALARKISREQYFENKDEVMLGKDFVGFMNRDLKDKWGDTHCIDTNNEETLLTIGRKIYMGCWDDVVTRWFLQTDAITDYAVLTGMREISRDNSALLQYSVFINTDKAKADVNGRFGIPHKPGVCGTDICDFSCCVKDFIYIDSFVSANGEGYKLMYEFLDLTADKTYVLMSAGFLFSGDYECNISEENTGALDKLVSYYKQLGFVDINKYIGQNEDTVAMLYQRDDDELEKVLHLIQ